MLAFSCARLAIIALEPCIKLKATRFVIAPIPFQRTFTEAIPTRQTTSAESAQNQARPAPPRGHRPHGKPFAIAESRKERR